MKLCDDGHEEVCYDSRYCPMCEKEKEIERWSEEADSMRATIDKLKEEIMKEKEE